MKNSKKNSKYLVLAAGRGDVARVQELLAKGMSPDSDDPGAGGYGHQTALQMAIYNESARCVELLLEAGASPTLNLGPEEAPPVVVAAIRSSPACLKLLLAAGAAVDTQNYHGCSALALAAHFGKFDCVSLLLSKGAEMDSADQDGETAVMLAASEGQERCLRALIEAGADVSAKNHEGKTAMSIAAKEGHGACVALLEAAELQSLVKSTAAIRPAKRM